MKTITLNWKKIIPYFIIIILLGTTIYYQNRASIFKDKYQTETKLSQALLDTVTYYKNSRDEVVAEKRTLQAELKDLQGMNDFLTKSQKELLVRIKEIEKNYTLIAAALIETNVIISDLRDGMVVVDTAAGNIKIRDSLPEIKYDFTLFNAKPVFFDQLPIFKINKLSLPNTQFIEFHWKNDKKEGYPVTFSVSNSNKYFSTANIESYVIPEVQKETLRPNFWQRLDDKLAGGDKIILGGLIGAGAVLLLR